MKRLLLLTFLLISLLNAKATSTTALSSGDWNEPALWSNGVPGCFDTIIIPASIQIDVTSTIDLNACPDSMIIFLYGRIEFQNGKKLKLPCNSDIMVFPGGSMGVGSGGGSSTYVEMCSTQYWNASSGDLAGPILLCDGGCPPSQLPIELVSFTADMRSNERVVDLHWVTKSEIDNDYFTVERSADGISWEALYNVDGAGNSSYTIHYSDTDNLPLYGVSYYRLKQTDFNGDFSYSPIVSVQDENINEISLYPNPVIQGGSIVIYLPESFNNVIDLNIYSADGKVVATESFDVVNNNQIIYNVPSHVAAGTYMIKIADENFRIIVQ
ncbi:T9SS type A sorting domain-containing protein [Paracrocinitomix mangrovi]|uniref:T9SS type A sorting domain-containing protein n=1 Tax=Paracrocinitomix mangrovi TaxID=2862509 RepID=UPI001C8E7943|nr:T9SS type A sorting domain-containing protein [Paracrocinitomix mangrovi]UKN00556.1 T9SS type A sorting domain-containing protein [Paracrocinitomix mangrovi]